jgi:hypothetical protein
MLFTVDKPNQDDDAELTQAVYHSGKARLVETLGMKTLSDNSAGYTYYARDRYRRHQLVPDDACVRNQQFAMDVRLGSIPRSMATTGMPRAA